MVQIIVNVLNVIFVSLLETFVCALCGLSIFATFETVLSGYTVFKTNQEIPKRNFMNK